MAFRLLFQFWAWAFGQQAQEGAPCGPRGQLGSPRGGSRGPIGPLVWPAKGGAQTLAPPHFPHFPHSHHSPPSRRLSPPPPPCTPPQQGVPPLLHPIVAAPRSRCCAPSPGVLHWCRSPHLPVSRGGLVGIFARILIKKAGVFSTVPSSSSRVLQG